MGLTPEEKQRIWDEEHNKMHEDQYCAEVRRELRNPEERRRSHLPAVIAAFLAVVLVSAILSNLNAPPAGTVFLSLIAAVVVAKKMW